MNKHIIEEGDMLKITVPPTEQWDSGKREFVYTKGQTLQLEHSLVSISKWESKWEKAFLSNTTDAKTEEETLDYVRCMTITQNVNPLIYSCLSVDNLETINKYIESPMTATYIYEPSNGRGSREPMTSELIYYWMIALNIPFECQRWHLNRLITLIKVCNVKNEPQKKRSRKELLSQNAALNAARRKKFNTKG